MTDMNLWQPTGEPAADYVTYKRIHEELGRVFKRFTEGGLAEPTENHYTFMTLI